MGIISLPLRCDYNIYFLINQREALYIINSVRNCISSKRSFVYHHCESFFDTHLKVWWDTRAVLPPLMIYALRRWYTIALAMDKKIDLQKQVYFLAVTNYLDATYISSFKRSILLEHLHLHSLTTCINSSSSFFFKCSCK